MVARECAVLKDTHWVGGDPRWLQVYGWASWSQEKSILVLRNPIGQGADDLAGCGECAGDSAGCGGGVLWGGVRGRKMRGWRRFR